MVMHMHAYIHACTRTYVYACRTQPSCDFNSFEDFIKLHHGVLIFIHSRSYFKIHAKVVELRLDSYYIMINIL
jgi:hypothetical protein